MEKYLAHINENGKEQTVLDHLNGVADLCAHFADSVGFREQAFLVGLMHDLGKCSTEF